MPAYAAAPEDSPFASAAGAVGAPSASTEGILPLSPLALNPQPLTSSTLLNPKKGSGMYDFSSINEALKGAQLSWIYNWWHTINLVRMTDPFSSVVMQEHATGQSCDASTMS